MKKYLIAASTFALLASSGAQAADIVAPRVDTPVVSAPAFSWQGFYAGGQIGGSWGSSKIKEWSSDGASGTKVKPDGFIGGLFAGYNFDIGDPLFNGAGSIVLGADTDFLWNDVDDTKTLKDGDQSLKLRVKQKWVGSTRLRAGYAYDRWLPYVAAGVAYSKIDVRSRLYTNGNLDGSNSKDKTRAGWTVGAGVDYAMTDNILLRVEYRYTDFGKKNYGFEGGSTRVKYNSNDIRVGVAYKF